MKTLYLINTSTFNSLSFSAQAVLVKKGLVMRVPNPQTMTEYYTGTYSYTYFLGVDNQVILSRKINSNDFSLLTQAKTTKQIPKSLSDKIGFFFKETTNN